MPTVLVTGANRGLGLEFVRQYAADGWDAIATCREPERATALGKLGVAIHRLDVTDTGAVAELAAALKGRAIDLLINNAGIYPEDRTTRIGALEEDEWMRTLHVNTVAPILVAQAFREHVLASQQRIFAFLSSGLGSIANNSGGGYFYRSSKAALNMAARSLAVDVAKKRGIVALLSPGWVRTDMGGSGADLSPETSVAGLRRVIAGLKASDSGKFLTHSGKSLPW